MVISRRLIEMALSIRERAARGEVGTTLEPVTVLLVGGHFSGKVTDVDPWCKVMQFPIEDSSPVRILLDKDAPIMQDFKIETYRIEQIRHAQAPDRKWWVGIPFHDKRDPSLVAFEYLIGKAIMDGEEL